MDDTLNALVAAGFGAAGQRCMALSTEVFVGGSMPWEELVKRAKSLKINVGTEPCADLGPLNSKEVKDRITRLVQAAVEGGVRLVLDGRNIVMNSISTNVYICSISSKRQCKACISSGDQSLNSTSEKVYMLANHQGNDYLVPTSHHTKVPRHRHFERIYISSASHSNATLFLHHSRLMPRLQLPRGYICLVQFRGALVRP